MLQRLKGPYDKGLAKANPLILMVPETGVEPKPINPVKLADYLATEKTKALN
ncbi:MAG: hypothetical protein ACK4TD_22410 [Ectopseudomonas guguanensis]|uniref:hypothetical protein n=1 Tax=Ectopseudomonas guguanensis TaxID=1198456 RepID=UPI00391ADDBC